MAFTYQKWIKWESETAIINALFEGEKRFGELLELTQLSKPVLIRRLKELKKKGKIEFVPEEETRRFHYELIKDKLDIDDHIQLRIDELTKITVLALEIFAKDPETSDIEYAKHLKALIPLLFQFRMLACNTANEEIQKEWLKVSLGLEFANNTSKIYPKERELFPEVTPFWELMESHKGDPLQLKQELLQILEDKIKTTREAFLSSS